MQFCRTQLPDFDLLKLMNIMHGLPLGTPFDTSSCGCLPCGFHGWKRLEKSEKSTCFEINEVFLNRPMDLQTWQDVPKKWVWWVVNKDGSRMLGRCGPGICIDQGTVPLATHLQNGSPLPKLVKYARILSIPSFKHRINGIYMVPSTCFFSTNPVSRNPHFFEAKPMPGYWRAKPSHYHHHLVPAREVPHLDLQSSLGFQLWLLRHGDTETRKLYFWGGYPKVFRNCRVMMLDMVCKCF